MYRQYFPLLALTTYAKVMAGTQVGSQVTQAGE